MLKTRTPILMRAALLGALLLAAALLAACAGQPPAQVSTPESQPTAGSPTAVSPASPTQPEAEAVSQETADYCLECHTSQDKLINSAGPETPQAQAALAEAFGQGALPMQPWEKVLVDGATFPQSIHGLNGCISCHGGVQAPDKEEAHAGIVRNPSAEPQPVCGECHPNVVEHSRYGLHATLQGFETNILKRSFSRDHPALDSALQQACSSCHTTCGDCHVSQPALAGGGFVKGHNFTRTPSMTRTCTICHGSRAGNEFQGLNAGAPADVHFSQGAMTCMNCHDGPDLHGDPAECQSCHPGPESSQLPPEDHRYAGVQEPSCESCHPAVATGQDEILMHDMHGSKLSCQVCHAVTYTSCEGCHAGVDEATGEATFELHSSFSTFMIGRNPLQTYDRPYEYVLLRHVPVSRDTFEAFGEDLLKAFDSLETWKYTTPHNIQRNTPQASSCNNCHGNPDLFLTPDKVSPDELEANRPVIVEGPPEPITSADQLPYR